MKCFRIVFLLFLAAMSVWGHCAVFWKLREFVKPLGVAWQFGFSSMILNSLIWSLVNTSGKVLQVLGVSPE